MTRGNRLLQKAGGFLIGLTLLSVLSGCFSVPVTPTPPTPAPNTIPATPAVDTTFVLRWAGTGPGLQNVALEILDEVTGLSLNPQRFGMESQGNNTFKVTIPIPTGSLVKYRYILAGSPPVLEAYASDQAVRYRMAYITSPQEIQDIVVGWTDRAAGVKNAGRIIGKIVDAATRAPISDVLVCAGGQQALSSADGYFILEGMSPGTHNLVAYPINGSHQPFQQGALIAENATTPAEFALSPSKMIQVLFLVKIPESDPSALVRLAGSLYGLGNMHGDLAGGISAPASRAPVMTRMPDGRYSLLISLPAGWDLRYKYTLGDGFWNAEHRGDGTFQTRQVILPQQDVVIEDGVETWKSGGSSAPIQFSATVPANTPETDTLSIQFNPYGSPGGWTEPIPMWKHRGREWRFTLYSPLGMLREVGYRYCRNDQCGAADDAATRGVKANGFPFSTSPIQQLFQDDIANWAWMKKPSQPTAVVAMNITPRDRSFWVGVELYQRDAYRPSWLTYANEGLKNIHSLGGKQVVVSPTWTFTRETPPILQPAAGKDPLAFDTFALLQQAKANQLEGVLFPRVRANKTLSKWWTEAKRDDGWWQSWFDRYTEFLRHQAALAQQTGASAIILGDPGVAPAFPGGTLSDGSPSGVPEDAVARWVNLIDQVRGLYKGEILWAANAADAQPPQEILTRVDRIYVLWSVPLSASMQLDPAAMAVEAGHQLDQKVLPWVQSTGKGVVLGLEYPSAQGAASGCVLAKDVCVRFENLYPFHADQPDAILSLDEQTQAYNAVLAAVNQREWITGVLSRGFFIPALLVDKSASVYGKPAADVLWYWFPRLTGQPES